jgi:preprotein translocase subunit SecA
MRARPGQYLRTAAAATARDLTGESDDALQEQAATLRETFRRSRDTPEDRLTAIMLVREAARRTLGLHAHPVQIAAALALLDGTVIELATGEGKTLVAGLAGAIMGWRGRGVHVITVNDYLATRDAAWMEPLFAFLGLSSACVVGKTEGDARRTAYLADITYTTNKEVAADFLRDRITLGRSPRLASGLAERMLGDGQGRLERLFMRGLACAIVDEADSVLIDEAVTPLIISGSGPNTEQEDAYTRAATIAASMTPTSDYVVDRRFQDVRLTDAGHAHAEELARDFGGPWRSQRRREELVTQAIAARELYTEGEQYVVQDGRIVIIDEFTGRLLPDRTWRDGLHQAVEAKEGLEVQAMQETLARISFQRFFSLYDHLGGMTGTARECATELWQTYRLPVVCLPTHKPCARKHLPQVTVTTTEEKWNRVIEEIKRVHSEGRPVLVGTRSVAASEQLSALLRAQGFDHEVLNAVRHAEEAEIVAAAGQPGRITIATNMAGRGTDIVLGDGVAAAGGLHVLATERHESPRVDRQLYGRAGRQGDPGSARTIAALTDEVVRRYAGPLQWLGRLAGPARAGVFRLAQRKAQAMAARRRRQVMRSDETYEESLGFAGQEQ